MVAIIHIALLAIPCFIMYSRGKKYAAEGTRVANRPVLNAIIWSFFVCWSIVIAGSHGGLAVFPLPSWLGIVLGILGVTKIGIAEMQFWPHQLLSPAIPLATYYIGFSNMREKMHNAS